MTQSIKRRLPPPDLSDPTLVALTVSETAVLLRCGENQVRAMIRDGGLPGVKVGERVRVPARAVRELLGVEVGK